MMKRCILCGQEKPHTEFHVRYGMYRRSRCKACHNIRTQPRKRKPAADDRSPAPSLLWQFEVDRVWRPITTK